MAFQCGFWEGFYFLCNLCLRLPLFSCPVIFRNISFVYCAVLTSSLFYRPQTKLREGNVFHLFVCWRGVSHYPSRTRPPLGPDPLAGRNMGPDRKWHQYLHPRITKAGPTHPTWMLSCFYMLSLYELILWNFDALRVTNCILWINGHCMIAGFSVFLIVMDNMARPPFSCKKENSVTCRIDENALDSGTGFPGMLTVFCNGQKEMYKVGRESKASIFVVIYFEESSPFYG